MSNLYVGLAKTSMKNGRQFYLPYFLTGALTVAMFYIMVYLASNRGLSSIPGNTSLAAILFLGCIVIGIFNWTSGFSGWFKPNTQLIRHFCSPQCFVRNQRMQNNILVFSLWTIQCHCHLATVRLFQKMQRQFLHCLLQSMDTGIFPG